MICIDEFCNLVVTFHETVLISFPPISWSNLCMWVAVIFCPLALYDKCPFASTQEASDQKFTPYKLGFFALPSVWAGYSSSDLPSPWSIICKKSEMAL